MKAKVTLVFNVTDPARLKTLADAAIASHGGGVETDQANPMALQIVELLLHSNPNVAAFLDYGIELHAQTLEDEVAFFPPKAEA